MIQNAHTRQRLKLNALYSTSKPDAIQDEEDRKEFIQNAHTRQRHSEYKDEVVRYADETWQVFLPLCL